MKADREDKYIVPAVEQAVQVLFHMASSSSSHLSLIEICSEVGIHKSKAYSILHTLQKFGLVERKKDRGGYSLGPGLIGLSRRFLDNLSAPELAEPILKELSGRVGTTAALGIIADKNVFVASKCEGSRPIVVTMRVGNRFPLTYGCHGKAIAAFLPEPELEKLLEEKRLYFYGDPAKFTRVRLMEDIERCRRDWYAEDAEETAAGLNAVAAPVLGPGDYPVGYIVVLGLASAEALRECGPLVAEAGKALSRQLGARIPVGDKG